MDRTHCCPPDALLQHCPSDLPLIGVQYPAPAHSLRLACYRRPDIDSARVALCGGNLQRALSAAVTPVEETAFCRCFKSSLFVQ
jgi:hypothetical protein